MRVMDGVRRNFSPTEIKRPAKKPRLVPEIPPVNPTGITLDGIRRIQPASIIQPSLGAIAKNQPSRLLRPAAMMLLAGLAVPAFILADRSLKPAAVIQPLSEASSASSTPEPNLTNPAVTAQSGRLDTLISSFAGQNPGSYGIYVEDLNSGAQAAANEEQAFTSASLYKLFVAHGVLRQADTGEINLSDNLQGRTVKDCLRIMINVSDNSCGRILGDKIGWHKYDDSLKDLGFTGTSLHLDRMQTTAKDVGLLLKRLYDGTLLSPASTDLFLEFLKEQRVNNRLPLGLPAGTEFAHKTGDLDGYVHDVGIVYGENTDYLVVMTSGPWTRPADAPPHFAKFSKLLYDEMN